MPAIHGFDGSETMTSYCVRPSSRCVRPSPTISRVRGSASAREFSGSKKREASTTSGEISSTSTRSSGWRERRPERDAAAEAEDRCLPGRRVQQQRHVRQQPLGEHVAGIRRVDLAVDGQRRRAGRVAHRDGGAGAVAVVEEPAGGQREFERIAGHRRGVLVGAARQQFRAPRWQGRAGHGGAGSHRGGPHPRPQRQPAPPGQGDGRQRGGDAEAAQRVVQPEAGDQEEAGGERAGDGPDGVHGVDEAEVGAKRGVGTGAGPDRERERATEPEGQRQEPRRGQQHLARQHRRRRSPPARPPPGRWPAGRRPPWTRPPSPPAAPPKCTG